MLCGCGCGKEFEPRKGGSPQRFKSGHRLEFWNRARREGASIAMKSTRAKSRITRRRRTGVFEFREMMTLVRVAARSAAIAVIKHERSRNGDLEYGTSAELGIRTRMSTGSMRNRIAEGYFGEAEGVVRVGAKVLVHWPTFKATVLSGDWSPNPEVIRKITARRRMKHGN